MHKSAAEIPEKEWYTVEETMAILGLHMNEFVIKDRRAMLRVKIKTLMEEARIIRKEERRTSGRLRNELHNHRVNEVRREARAAHLAYGLIRGRTLERIEGAPKHEPNWKRVHELLRKYGPVGADWSHLPGAPPPMSKSELKRRFTQAA